MRVLILDGGPKKDAGNTMALTRAFVSGFPADAAIKTEHLYEKNIRPCAGCFSCWTKTPGKCVIADDMQALYRSLEEADIIIQSFPLYFYGMPAVMKGLIDRCLPLTLPLDTIGDNLSACHRMRNPHFCDKRLAILSTCGHTRAATVYPALDATLDLIWGKGTGTRIYCAEGEVLTCGLCKRQVNAYLEIVRQAGREFYADGVLSPATVAQLARPILSPSTYQTIASHRWS